MTDPKNERLQKELAQTKAALVAAERQDEVHWKTRLTLLAENERLRALLKEAVDCTENCCGCISQHGGDLKARIDAALAAKEEK